ncbi:hypothetical protein ACGFY0_34115 [Streptomyces chartreusis]|uniref:hypothetical protein n=1 Tax=Streptomyces chartreusis TaxID=1969 RepID=UPI0037196CCE
MTAWKVFGRFWIDFIIGDDWKVAAAVVTALSLLVGALSLGVLGEAELTVLGGVVMVAAFAVGLAIDVRRNRGG